MSKLLLIEGMDGVGKTTTAMALCKELGYKYLHFMQPPFDQSIREIFKSNIKMCERDLHLRFLECIRNTSDIVEKNLQDGNSIVLDRYIYTCRSYHVGFSCKEGVRPLEIDIEDLKIINSKDAFFLDLENNKERILRIQGRGGHMTPSEKISLEDRKFDSIVRNEFLKFSDQGYLKRIKVDGLNPNDVVNDILDQLSL